jgi:SHS2 domain-containing protein
MAARLVIRQAMGSRSFYKIIDHTADIGIEVWAPDREGVFTRSAMAMFDMMLGLDSVTASETREIQVAGEGLEELLVAWLNELLYVYSVEKMVFSGFSEVDLGENTFSALVAGERFDPLKHSADLEIKAATYHDLSVRCDKGRWKARIIFDV